MKIMDSGNVICATEVFLKDQNWKFMPKLNMVWNYNWNVTYATKFLGESESPKNVQFLGKKHTLQK